MYKITLHELSQIIGGINVNSMINILISVKLLPIDTGYFDYIDTNQAKILIDGLIEYWHTTSPKDDFTFIIRHFNQWLNN